VVHWDHLRCVETYSPKNKVCSSVAPAAGFGLRQAVHILLLACLMFDIIYYNIVSTTIKLYII
jgi:hypothetical protein